MKIETENVTMTVAPQATMADQQPFSPLTFHGARGDAESRAEKPQIQEELVIEEISIDGMCGVY